MPGPLQIGEPIPKGFVDRDGIHAASTPDKELDVQLSLLRRELDALRGIVSRRMRQAGHVAEAHPWLTATAFSIGIWALIALFFRRYRT